MENTYYYDNNENFSKDITDEIIENSNRDANQIKAFLNNDDYDMLIEYMIKQHEAFINLNKNVLSKIYKLKFMYLMLKNQVEVATNLFIEDIQIFNRETFSSIELERKNFFYRNCLNGKIELDENHLILEKNVLSNNILVKFIFFYTQKIKKYKDLTYKLSSINEFINNLKKNQDEELNISNLLNSEEESNYNKDYYYNLVNKNEVRFNNL